MQSAQGQFGLVHNTKDIEQLINNNIDMEVRRKLMLVMKVREFSASELGLSFNDSYTQYAVLKRTYVVKNLLATEEFSTMLYAWCYPVIGCANYRGYFDEGMLQLDRGELKARGYDTYVVKVSAYSTLGWFDDPVLSTFLQWPEYKLVGLIFHELAHQQVYIEDDTFFNESFAMAVEQAGLERWYSDSENAAQLENYRKQKKRKDIIVEMAGLARNELDQLYRLKLPTDEKRRQKNKIFQQLHQQYRSLAMTWGDDTGLEGLVNGEINNAWLGVMDAYNKYVPAFLAILKSNNNNLPLFYSQVTMLGEMDAETRKQCLLDWSRSYTLSNRLVADKCR